MSPNLLPRVGVRLLASLFARLAPHRERQRSQSSFSNVAVALGTGPILARVELAERVGNAGQRFRPHLKERECQILLNVGLRVFEVVTPLRRSGGAAVTDVMLDVVLQLASALDQ